MCARLFWGRMRGMLLATVGTSPLPPPPNLAVALRLLFPAAGVKREKEVQEMDTQAHLTGSALERSLINSKKGHPDKILFSWALIKSVCRLRKIKDT